MNVSENCLTKMTFNQLKSKVKCYSFWVYLLTKLIEIRPKIKILFITTFNSKLVFNLEFRV
jgi:hypothetical protein